MCIRLTFLRSCAFISAGHALYMDLLYSLNILIVVVLLFENGVFHSVCVCLLCSRACTCSFGLLR